MRATRGVCLQEQRRLIDSRHKRLQCFWPKLKKKNPKIVVMSPTVTTKSFMQKEAVWQSIQTLAENTSLFVDLSQDQDSVVLKGTIHPEKVPLPMDTLAWQETQVEEVTDGTAATSRHRNSCLRKFSSGVMCATSHDCQKTFLFRVDISHQPVGDSENAEVDGRSNVHCSARQLKCTLTRSKKIARRQQMMKSDRG